MLYALILISMLISLPVKAYDFQNEALKITKDSEEKKLLYLEEANELKENIINKMKATLSSNDTKEASSCCEKALLKEEALENEYLIFVSFSIPFHTLKSLYEEAKKNNAILVLRGLKNNSFKKTGEYLKELGIELQINPELFNKYQIQKVPTFVWVTKNEYHSLSGNVSFKFAKQKFQEIAQ